MLIMLDKYKYICCYCESEYSADGYIEIDNEGKSGEELCFNYQYINDKLIHNPIPKDKPLGVKVIYDGSKFLDLGTPQEKQDFWKKKMIETNNQIKELQEIGLGGGSEESSLRAKLEEYRTQYMNAVQEEAIEIDKGMA